MDKQPQFIEFGDYSVNVDEILYFWQRNDSIQCFQRSQVIPMIQNHIRDPQEEFRRIYGKLTGFVWIADYLINPKNFAYVWHRDSQQVQAFMPGSPIPLCGKLHDLRLETICQS